MSRGIGRTQREAMICLWLAEEGCTTGMRVAEFKRYISTDRSNARRAIRGLIDRGFVEEITGEEGERRVRLTGGGHLALWLAAYPDQPLDLSDVPSRPLDLDVIDHDATFGDPHGWRETSWINADVSESAISDHAPSARSRGRGSRTNQGEPNQWRGSQRARVSNNERRGSVALEIAQKMARRVLARLDDEG